MSLMVCLSLIQDPWVYSGDAGCLRSCPGQSYQYFSLLLAYLLASTARHYKPTLLVAFTRSKKSLTLPCCCCRSWSSTQYCQATAWALSCHVRNSFQIWRFRLRSFLSCLSPSTPSLEWWWSTSCCWRWLRQWAAHTPLHGRKYQDPDWFSHGLESVLDHYHPCACCQSPSRDYLLSSIIMVGLLLQEFRRRLSIFDTRYSNCVATPFVIASNYNLIIIAPAESAHSGLQAYSSHNSLSKLRSQSQN